MNEGQKSLFESPIDEIRVIIERHLFPIYAGMISLEFYSRESGTPSARSSPSRARRSSCSRHGGERRALAGAYSRFMKGSR
jgi:hypothetical protein